MTPSRAITDADLRQCSPAAMARELGWPRPPGTVSWSWALLMDVAGRRYALNRAQKADVRMTSAKGSSSRLEADLSTGTSDSYRRDSRGETVHRADCRHIRGRGSAWPYADGMDADRMVQLFASHKWLRPCATCRPDVSHA